MAKQHNDGNILCPFYHNCGKRSVSCEGITDDSIIYLQFLTIRSRNLHRRIFCESAYKNCEIYRMLEKKYED